MKIAMINGSPKSKNSASGELLRELMACLTTDVTFKEFCFNTPKIGNEIIDELNLCDVFVFAYPLYVDGIPSHLLSCLRQIEEIGIQNRSIMVFGIANSGFYEGKQNAIALEILENWCNKLGLQWAMGLGIGGGGSLSRISSTPLGRWPKKSLGIALHTLREHIENKTSAENLYISVDFPRCLYKIGAEMGWKQMIKKNGGKPKDLNYKY